LSSQASGRPGLKHNELKKWVPARFEPHIRSPVLGLRCLSHIPLNKVSEALSAIQRLAEGIVPGDEDEDDEAADGSVC